MRNKSVIAIILICCLLFFGGCDSANDSYTWSTDPNGNRVMSNQSRVTTFADNLPIKIAYNSDSISVASAALYQDQLSDYSYLLCLVAAVDVSNLDEAQIHWLRESDISVGAYLTSEKNNYDFDSMTTLGSLLHNEQGVIYYVFTSSFYKDNRYDFAGSEITLAVSVTQEETYEYEYDGNATEANKVHGIHYSVNIDSLIPSINSISEPLLRYLDDWLDDHGIAVPPVSAEDSKETAAETEPYETQGQASATKDDKPSETTPAKKTPTETTPPATQPPQPAGPTTAESNALKKAKEYLQAMPFSRNGLIDQLEYEGFSTNDATYGADNCGADWNAQALEKAKDYLEAMAFSYSGLVDQLEYEGFTSSQAKHGADNCGADWYEQAAKSAAQYVKLMTFTRSDLISQLEYGGFTHDQAVHGADSVGL